MGGAAVLTDEQVLDDYLRRLQSVTAALATANSDADIGDAVIDHVLPALGADGGVLALVVEDGSLEVVRTEGYGLLYEDFRRMDVDAGLPLSEAVRLGHPVWISSSAERAARFPAAAEIPAIHEALCAVPLVASHGPVGVLGASFRDARPFGDHDRTFLVTVAQQCAIAIERGRLETGVRARALAAEEQARSLEALQRAGSALAGELDLQTVIQTVTDTATELAGAEFGAFFYNVVRPDGEAFMLYTLSGAPAEAFAHLQMPRSTALFGPTFRGETVIRLDDVLADGRYGHNEPWHGMPPGHLAVRSYLAVPVLSRSGQVHGGLFFGHQDPGRFTESAERLVAGLAAHAGVAIDNARLYEQEQRARAAAEEAARRAEHDRRRMQELARALQTSLLPPTLPDMPGVELSARYLAAMPGLEVGGDFYDVFDTGGDWALAIGDVCGKGPEAAALTALARYTLRSVAMDVRQPAQVLRKLNDVLLHQQLEERFCTVAYVRVVPIVQGVRASVCRGGHPPPLLLRASGAVESLGPHGGLLGLFPDIRLWEETAQLAVGDSLILYTDGVIEATAGGEQFGDRRMYDVLTGLAGEKPDVVAEALETAVLDFGGAQPRDDLAILVLQVAD